MRLSLVLDKKTTIHLVTSYLSFFKLSITHVKRVYTKRWFQLTDAIDSLKRAFQRNQHTFLTKNLIDFLLSFIMKYKLILCLGHGIIFYGILRFFFLSINILLQKIIDIVCFDQEKIIDIVSY